MERRNLLIIIFFCCTLLFSCQSAPENISHNDWASVTLNATCFGPIETWTPAERIRGIKIAKADCARQLEEKILSLKTDSLASFREKVIKEEKMEKVAAYVRGAEVIAIENKKEGVKIDMRLPLGEPFKAAFGLLKRKELAPSGGGRNSSGSREGQY